MWSRAGDISLILAFVLALPVTWFFNETMTQTEPVASVVGVLQRDGEGGYAAHLSHEDEEDLTHGVPQAQLWGAFDVQVDRMERGFPVVTSVLTRQPIIELTRFSRAVGPKPDVSPGSEARDAIRRALRADDEPEPALILDLWEAGGVRAEQQYLGWVAGSVLWAVTLFVVFSLLILFARIATILMLRQQSAVASERIAAGCCPNCGYSLRGLEFSERCPECGQIQWE